MFSLQHEDFRSTAGTSHSIGCHLWHQIASNNWSTL